MLRNFAPPCIRPHPNVRACSFVYRDLIGPGASEMKALLCIRACSFVYRDSIGPGVSEMKALLCWDGPDIYYVDAVVAYLVLL